MSELAGERFQHLVGLMRTLRSDNGCAWDRQQTLKTLRPFVLQETYELLDALDRGDHDALKHELGDFLFEAVFLAQICEEEGRFSIADSIPRSPTSWSVVIRTSSIPTARPRSTPSGSQATVGGDQGEGTKPRARTPARPRRRS